MYTIQIDLDRDETYAAPGADITAYVLEAAWQTGMNDSYDEVSQPARLTLTLDNSSGVFSPENSASPYYGKLGKRPLVRVRATHDSLTHTLFQGKLVSVRPTIGANDAALCTFTVEDPLLALLDAEYAPPLQESVTVDAALTPLFEQPVVVYPYASAYWIVEVGALDSGTKLFGTLPIAFDPGVTVLPYVGDNLDRGRGVSAQGFIRDLIAAEAGGRFFFDARAGKFTFHSRQHDILNPAITQSFTAADFTAAEYIYGGDVANDVTINFQPRSVGAPGSVLWTASNLPLRLRRGETRRLTARYTDPLSDEKARIGARATITPVPGLDYIANRKADGSGANRTRQLSIHTIFEAERATITLSNPTPRDLYVTTLQLRGTPIRSYEMQTVSAVDGASIAAYERQPRVLTIPALADAEFAAQYAAFLVSRFREPLARLRSVTLSAAVATFASGGCGADRLAAIYTRCVGDRIHISEAGSSHDRDYLIVGERHRIEAGAHTATWILLPADRTQYWRVSDGAAYTDLSALDSTTRLML